MFKEGIYEQVINKLISSQLDGEPDKVTRVSIDKEEASKVISKYVAEVIEKGLESIKDKGGDISSQLQLVNKIVDVIQYTTGESIFKEMMVDKSAELLYAYIDKKNTAYAINPNKEIIRPVTSISQGSLFTGSLHEPSMFTELKREILSCNRIDMLVSFIKWSGLRLIIDELKEFSKNGKLRIITTSYMGVTDCKSIEELNKLPNTEIKISYNTKSTRLHAKTYIFYRDTGFTTAYIGSSNLSNAAISSGLEWNVKVTAKDLPQTLQKIDHTFESYWNSKEFELYDSLQGGRLKLALKDEIKYNIADFSFHFDILPYNYQQEILDILDSERKVHGHIKNLVVAATGTGKTVISAFDYKRFCTENKQKINTILFVAHREEILKQSLDCFRVILKDSNFGELFVGAFKPDSLNHLFISIQTFNSREVDKITTPEFYDFIVVDEFHHAASPSYQKLLTYYKPKILLGLTATPERMDGKSIIEYFDNRISAEIRLPEAIERKLLSPFQYFGVSDSMDLSHLRWPRGGYDKSDLSKVYTGNDIRAKMVISALEKYCTDLNDIKGLGFCVSKEHAKYMSKIFNKYDVPAMYLISETSDEERFSAKKLLVSGKIKIIFVVDLYNEGVDIPEVNTILFLRPTESLTIFLQQLGRGLRLSENKECLTVLDFIAAANKKYSFEEKFSALLENTSKGIHRELKEGFISLPKGCYIQLEKKAREYILENIRNAFGNRTGIITKIASFEDDTGKTLSLRSFVEHYHIGIRTIYSKDSFSRLCVLSGVKDDFKEPDEELLSKALSRIVAIDSRRWISFLLNILPIIENVVWENIMASEQRMLTMLHYTIYQKPVDECGFNNVLQSIIKLKTNKVLFSELLDLLQYSYEKINFIDEPVDVNFDCPLDLHCTYTRDQILVGLDYLKPHTVREGVKYLENKKTDVFFITLNKSDKDYSPTTMYNDYSINEFLFHWQSQSTTSSQSPTGQRYINHRHTGKNIMLFVREFKKDMAGSSPYTFLGLADYVKHEGDRPMSITWRLRRPIPAKYLKKTNKMIIG